MAPFMGRTQARRAVIALGLLAGCSEAAPEPVLWSVEPTGIYTDRAQRLILRGEGFLPSFTVDPVSGARVSDASGFRGFVGLREEAAQLTEFTWRSPNELSATLEPHLPLGFYTVVVIDPRDQHAVLARGFSSLGEDKDKPMIVVESPSEQTPVAPGSQMRVRFTADDRAGRLLEVAGDAGGPPEGGGVRNRCPVPPQVSKLTCEFDVFVPTTLREGDRFDLRLLATDDAPGTRNTGETTMSFTLLAPPALTEVTPASGGVAGGTDVIVRGHGFLPGSRVLIASMHRPGMEVVMIPLMPDGGIRIDDNTFTGRMPAHDAGMAVVTVETPLGRASSSAFRYYAAPQITAVKPPEAPASGNLLVVVSGTNFTRDTRIYIGAKLSTAIELSDQQLTADTEIRGIVPPGQGLATVWAFDPFAGWSALADGFSWFPAPDGGATIEDAEPAPEDADPDQDVATP
jgi:hypothetical protein